MTDQPPTFPGVTGHPVEPTPPVPSGESPLEERLRDLAAGVELSTGVFRSSPTLGQTRATVTLSREAADELARLRSEVARLTAELAEARDNLRRECEASEHHRAEAARYREALEEIRDPVGAMQKRAARDGFRLDGAMAVSMARSASYLQEIARAVLTTEGGDHA